MSPRTRAQNDDVRRASRTHFRGPASSDTVTPVGRPLSIGFSGSAGGNG